MDILFYPTLSTLFRLKMIETGHAGNLYSDRNL
jgi:hypothetical protein